MVVFLFCPGHGAHCSRHEEVAEWRFAHENPRNEEIPSFGGVTEDMISWGLTQGVDPLPDGRPLLVFEHLFNFSGRGAFCEVVDPVRWNVYPAGTYCHNRFLLRVLMHYTITMIPHTEPVVAAIDGRRVEPKGGLGWPFNVPASLMPCVEVFLPRRTL